MLLCPSTIAFCGFTLGSFRLRSGAGGLSGMAQVQEARDAVLHFRLQKAGAVPTIYYCDSVGESSNGTLQYYFASSFAQVLGFVMHKPGCGSLG